MTTEKRKAMKCQIDIKCVIVNLLSYSASNYIYNVENNISLVKKKGTGL